MEELLLLASQSEVISDTNRGRPCRDTVTHGTQNAVEGGWQYHPGYKQEYRNTSRGYRQQPEGEYRGQNISSNWS